MSARNIVPIGLMTGQLLLLGCHADDRLTGPAPRPPVFEGMLNDALPGTGGTVCGTLYDGPVHEYTSILSLGTGPLCETSIGMSGGPVSPPPNNIAYIQWSYLAPDAGPISVAFSQPVNDLYVSSYGAAVHCGSDYGSVIAHTVSGESITIPLQEVTTADYYCGKVWYYSAYGLDSAYWQIQDAPTWLTAPLPDGVAVDRITISPPPATSFEWQSCRTWSSFDPPYTECWTQHGSLQLALLFREFGTDLNAGIVVSCPNVTVIRGSTITCQAEAESPGATLVVTGWTFHDLAGNVVPRDDASRAETTWSGQVVTNGMIIVTGTVNGQVASGVAAVTVAPRDWSAKTVVNHQAPTSVGQLPIHPDSIQNLGGSVMDLLPRSDVTIFAPLIQDGGPNENFYYLIDFPWEALTAAYVNYPAMTQGSDWYLIQYPKNKVVRGFTYCGQPTVLKMPPLVEAHEGTDPANQPNSHIGIFLNDVTRDSRVLAEGLVGPSLKFNTEPTRIQIKNAAGADSKAMDKDSRNNITNVTMGCDDFLYDYTRLPH